MWKLDQVLVAHAYNPSYSGGRDEEDHSSKATRANSSQDPILKMPITKKSWWSGLRCRSEFKPQYSKKKKKKVEIRWHISYPSIKLL
jgi:hypothetical protein